ncbi:MAG TPA: hypothetical protein VG106_11830 [Vicinamibacterales bacterium]|nr:hypothetical protein [Vicinamibacterales bacterium]
MEFHVRTARVTDVDQAIRVLSAGHPEDGEPRDAGDVLRQLLYLPSSTTLVAVSDRRVLGVGVLALRPSVRMAAFIGSIDELSVLPPVDLGDDGETARVDVARALLDQLLRSARNKGCSAAEVTDPVAAANADIWERMGFVEAGVRWTRDLGTS